jgi:uroporphyrinogen-III decarboxylase
MLASFNLPDFVPGGRMEDRIRGIELLLQRVGQELFVEGWVEGPCAEGADLRGINHIMLYFSDDPYFVNDLFSVVVEGAIRFARPQIEAGADIIGIGDVVASLVGPRIYKEFVWPWEKKLVDAIHEMGGRVRLHICGKNIKAWPCDTSQIPLFETSSTFRL